MGAISQSENSKSSNKSESSTFDLNLAPFLDIIVSIIPLLLLSSVFIEIKMIETKVESSLKSAIHSANKKISKDISLGLKIAKSKNIELVISQNGKKEIFLVPNLNGEIDFLQLSNKSLMIKNKFPELFEFKLSSSKNIVFKDLVKVMDQLRIKDEHTFEFKNPDNGEILKTSMMFPNVVFNIGTEE